MGAAKEHCRMQHGLRACHNEVQHELNEIEAQERHRFHKDMHKKSPLR